MQLNLIIGMVSQYYVLFDLFYAGDHTRCAPIKRYYCNFDVYRSYDELHCWIKNIIIETINQTDTLIWPYMMSTPYYLFLLYGT